MNFNELNNQSTVYVDSTLQTTTMRHVFTWMLLQPCSLLRVR